MYKEIETSSFMPKAVTKDNSVIPMQLNRAELEAILSNAEIIQDNDKSTDRVKMESVVKLHDIEYDEDIEYLNTEFLIMLVRLTSIVKKAGL